MQADQKHRFVSTSLRFSRSQRNRLRDLFEQDRPARDIFIRELWDRITSVSTEDFASQSEDFFILGVQSADMLPHIELDTLIEMLPPIGADQMSNSRLIAFLMGFEGQDFAATANTKAVAAVTRRLAIGNQWAAAAS